MMSHVTKSVRTPKGKPFEPFLCVCVCVLNIELSCGRARQETTDNVAERERRSDFTPLLLSKVYLNRKTEKKGVKSLGDTHFQPESQRDASTKIRKHLIKLFFCSCANLIGDLKNTQFLKLFSVGS